MTTVSATCGTVLAILQHLSAVPKYLQCVFNESKTVLINVHCQWSVAMMVRVLQVLLNASAVYSLRTDVQEQTAVCRMLPTANLAKISDAGMVLASMRSMIVRAPLSDRIDAKMGSVLKLKMDAISRARLEG
eukprot:PhF_6_TR15979/c0_g1_i1/m.25024